MFMTLLRNLFPSKQAQASRRAAERRRAHAGDAGPSTLLRLCEADTNWHHWRTPENDHDRALSSASRAWIQALPEEVRPFDLAARHPRVVNRIALCWNDPALIERLFDELLVDRRGGRKGFAPGVAEDLLRLRMHHEKQFAHDPGTGKAMWQMQTVAAGDRDSAFHRL